MYKNNITEFLTDGLFYFLSYFKFNMLTQINGLLTAAADNSSLIQKCLLLTIPVQHYLEKEKELTTFKKN